MSPKVRPFFGVLACFLLLLRAAPAAEEKKVDFSDLEKVALAELKETNTPGAAIAIVRGDQVIFAKGLGVASVETGEAVSPEMLFRLGSTTKMFTAAALVTLAEQGKLRLDEPVGRYVKGLSPKVAEVTPHQLLSHTAGIWDEAPMFGRQDDAALGDVIRQWKDEIRFLEPGRIFSYSNPGYWLAGLVVETVGGRPYADQVAETVLRPLGMNRSTFRPTWAMTYPLAQGHEVGRDGKPHVVRPVANNAASWPAGSLYSSATELARFVIAFLNDGKIDGKQALAPGVIAKLAAPHVALPGGERRYGYGLGLERHRGLRLIEHGGSRLGHGSSIRMAPEHRVGVIIVANRSGSSLRRTSDKALELLLPLGPAETKPKTDLPISEAEMTRYAGRYVHNLNTVELLVKDGCLFRKQRDREQPLRKVGENRFTAGATEGSEFVLVPGPSGDIEYLHAGGRTMKKIAGSR